VKIYKKRKRKQAFCQEKKAFFARKRRNAKEAIFIKKKRQKANKHRLEN
jgi:hypothetical protein